MSFSRRTILKYMAASSAIGINNQAFSVQGLQHWTPWVPNHEDMKPGPVFRHGVASGDPLPYRVVLWTRVTPVDAHPVAIQCIISSDPGLKNIIQEVPTYATASRDFTVKIDVSFLQPGQIYYYQFRALNESSPVGRTQTLPLETDRVRLGVASCANWPYGFFGAYQRLSQQPDLNAIVHVGDYIYEYENGVYGDGTDLNRIPEPNRETVLLEDYRQRYAQYRRDPQLQEAHRLHPWIMVWDDHEISNDAFQFGAENHQAEEGDWEGRKAMAMKAYFEWLPIRSSVQASPGSERIFRRFGFGDLLQLDMLDTRVFGREQPVPLLFDVVSEQLLVSPEALDGYLAEINRPDRQLLGQQQEDWLYQQLEQSQQRNIQWQVLGQQVMMGQLTVSTDGLPEGMRIPLNPDQWDGYTAARNRLLNFLKNQNIDNTIILAGDFHSSWAHEIAHDPYDTEHYDPQTGMGVQAVEFVAPAITSPFFVDPDPVLIQGLEQFALSNNPHTQYVDLQHNGYMVVDFDRQRTRAEWYYMDDILNPDTGEFLAATVEVESSSHRAILV